MKATVYTDDYTVIFEGEAEEVNQAVRDFFNDEEKEPGGEYKPNYAVHPAETVRELIDAKGGITESMSFNLSNAFGIDAGFFTNLWRNYDAFKRQQ